LATQRKTIPIKQHNRVVNKYESQLFKQLGDITKLGEKILDLESKIKVLEETLETERKDHVEDDKFNRNRYEIQLLAVESLTERLEQAQIIILNLGRIMNQDEAHIRSLKMSKYNNYYANQQPFDCNATEIQNENRREN